MLVRGLNDAMVPHKEVRLRLHCCGLDRGAV